MLNEKQLAEVKAAANLGEVLEAEGVTLKPSGRGYVALCIHHSERTPSMSVNPHEGYYYCFGCQENGDVFAAMQELRNLDFREAALEVARIVGLPLTDVGPGATEADKNAKGYAINAAAAAWYTKQVAATTPGAAEAREYLLGRRGFTTEVCAAHGVGYAPREGGGKALTDYLVGTGKYNLADCEEWGLTIPADRGGYRDRFLGRIMWPIKDARGRTLGFNGRATADSNPSKYLNTAATPVFNKGSNLYGVDLAARAARQYNTIYLSEGVTDVMAYHQAGIANAVATCGTALTTQHVRALQRLVGDSGTVILGQDGDAAGMGSMRKSWGVLRHVPLDVQCILWPTGSDPDGYLAAHGRTAFLLHTQTHRPLLEVLVWDAWDSEYTATPEGTAAAARAAIAVAKTHHDPLVVQGYIAQVTARAGATPAYAEGVAPAPDKHPAPTPEPPAGPTPGTWDGTWELMACALTHPTWAAAALGTYTPATYTGLYAAVHAACTAAAGGGGVHLPAGVPGVPQLLAHTPADPTEGYAQEVLERCVAERKVVGTLTEVGGAGATLGGGVRELFAARTAEYQHRGTL